VLRQTVRLIQPNSPPKDRGVSLHTKKKKGTQGQSKHNAHGRLVKAGPTFDQLLAKYASKKAVLRDRPTNKPRSPAKTKRPDVYSSCDARILSTHLLIIDILSCSNMEWYDDEPIVYE
jgi:hypothetical protein